MLAAAVLVAGCDGKRDASGQDAGAPQTVEAIVVQAGSLALSSELPGRVEPVRVAEVRARVAGIVLSRNFTEGADVKAGQRLFQIDPAPFKAALLRAQSELAKAEASLFDAQAVMRRYEPLVAIEAVSRQDYDAAQARLKSAQAERQAALAGIETARLDLGYATVTAPISGRIGRALVTEGALVGQNEATPLATIQQIDAVHVDFKQPVAEVLSLREALAEGRLAQDEGKGARISVTVEGTGQRRDGHLLFSDITVDRGTGQISLRGRFDNADGLLLPGMYVRVHTPQGTDPQAILVPQRAVQRGTDGKPLVLVVDQDDTAQARAVQTGTMHGAQWHITEGLQAGDRVIVGGRAKPGDKVSVAAPVQPAAPASATN
ncbi:efflux RND transporter periplasmic adaptor subunit [Thauera linaloolentis]|uniref:RND family efflux transporter MFP subunit n=2 Tax=Thauera linaloolentis TaxID=76112 RepID=N6YE74_THAL4|nr:efflux RND transporter periplasmic adaptor subunit [Thauera linaloolentis]ENO89820.1 RND family efflux transporter MFP subunit [Thauera linaloolentis 47Lol = DSM 12138]